MVLFSVSRFFFEPMYLYHELPWLDIPMHILGGLGVSFLVHAVYSYKESKTVSLKYILYIYCIIAVAWELYEYIRGAMTYSRGLMDYLDTVKDFIGGGIGVVIGNTLLKRRISRQ